MTDQSPPGAGTPPGAGAPPPPNPAAPGYPPAPGAPAPGAQPGYVPPGYPPPGSQPPVVQASALDPSAPITQDDKLWAALAHGAFFVFGIFGPLIIMMLYKEKSYYVTFHAKQAMIFQIVAVVGGIVTCGLLSLVCMVFAIIAALKAYEGQYYTYPGMTNISP